jgi:hypothetical protein
MLLRDQPAKAGNFKNPTNDGEERDDNVEEEFDCHNCSRCGSMDRD